jgi:hypothetical protein
MVELLEIQFYKKFGFISRIDAGLGQAMILENKMNKKS